MVENIRADTLQAMNSYEYLCQHVRLHIVVTVKVKIRVGAPAYLADKRLPSRPPALLCNSDEVTASMGTRGKLGGHLPSVCHLLPVSCV